ncbi:MAG: carboxypeptidase regulatory-like domain-containing protein [Deltaproteobacteria bacterium]|nr:carboxypeptidase regulatory-like domain-containing protein [Deltaproteobacteria bacterium]
MKRNNFLIKSLIKLVLIIFFAMFSISTAHAQSTVITNGLSWLSNNQNSDGSIGNITSTTDITRTTVAVIDTLQALSQTNTTLYSNAISWLQSQSISTTDYLSERMSTHLSGGSDEGLLVSYIDPASGVWGGYEGYGINNLDTALALSALKSVNYSNQTSISNAVLYLVTNQNTDGGWGFYAGDDSNVYMTAMVSYTLEQFARTSSIATVLNNAMNYLTAHQNSDGGFGSSPSTVYETALAYIALVGLTTDNTILGNAANYLSSTQANDGSWNEDAYSTALALRALYLSENKPSPPPQVTTGTITGKVVDALTNQSLNGVSVILVSNPSISATTDSSGNFSLANVPQGSQQVSFLLAGYASSTVTANVSGGSVVNLGNIGLSVIQTTGIIKGTVTEASSGQPLGGVAITVTGAYNRSIATGVDGSFIFTNVTLGSVTITASKAGYYPVSGTGTVVAGGILFFNPQLSTQPPTATTGSITGKVLDASTSQPITGATISISGRPSATTDAQGVFLVQGITAGTYQVSIFSSGYTSQNYQVMVSAGATADLQTIYLMPIPTSTTITGRVLDAMTGAPVTGASVMIAGTNLSAKTDASGMYTISGISALAFTVIGSAPGYDSTIFEVTTNGFGTITINFQMNESQSNNISIISLTTDNVSYSANANVSIIASIENTGATPITGIVTAEIQDMYGQVIAVVGPQNPKATFVPSSINQANMQWNTGQFPAGTYKIILNVTGSPLSQYRGFTGTVYAQKSTEINIESSAQLIGSISLNPPVTSANTPTFIEISAGIRNNGNIPISTPMQLTVSLNNNTMYTTDTTISNLAINHIRMLDLGGFIPQEGGNYSVILNATDPSIASDITTTYYVGPYAVASFTVSPQIAPPGNININGDIHLTAGGLLTGTTNNPMKTLMLDAIQKGVNYEQTEVVQWEDQNSNTQGVSGPCYGCHVQSQTLVGLELASNKVTVDTSLAWNLMNFLRSIQGLYGTGDVSNYYGYGSIDSTMLALWAFSSWHNVSDVQNNIISAANYLLLKTNRYGTNEVYWLTNYVPWDLDWWSNPVSMTSIGLVGFTEAYTITNNPDYLNTIEQAERFVINPGSFITAPDMMIMAHQIIGLESAGKVVSDTVLNAQADNLINSNILQLETNQNSDGGWGRYIGWQSDSLVTAQILYALLQTSVDPWSAVINKAINFLINAQQPDGSWYSQDGIMNTRLAATTWVIIALPVAAEKVLGVNTSTNLVLPSNIILNSSIPTPTSITSLPTGETGYNWSVTSVDANGTDILLNLTLKDLGLGESKPVADSAYLSFQNTYNGQTVNMNIPIPEVTGTSFIQMNLATDKPVYSANTDVNISTSIYNGSAFTDSLVLSMDIEDANGVTVATFGDVNLPAISSGQSVTQTTFWNTGTVLSGPYMVHAILTDTAGKEAEQFTSFTILSSGAITGTAVISCDINTDKISYNPNEIAVINGTVNNLSANTMLSGDEMEISVLNPSGAIVGGYSALIPLLVPQGYFTAKYNWNTGISSAGTYQAVLKVLDSSGTLLTQATTSFGINSTSDNLTGLTGVISIAPQSLESGNNISVSYSITNNGNSGVSITPSVMLVSPQSQQPLTISTTSASIATQATYGNTFSYPVTCQMFGDYIAALKASNAKTVAQTWFRVVDLTPPVVSITGVVDNGCYNTPSPGISITDCHLSSQSILLNGNPYVSGTPISTDGNDVLTATGSDLGGNATTKSVHFKVDTIAPLITITGITDGVAYTSSVTPVISISDANLINSTITLDGIPYISGTPITEQGKHILSVSASDCAGNQSAESVSFTVMSVKLDVTKGMITPPGVLIFDMDQKEGGGCDKDRHDTGNYSGQLISALTTLLTNAGYYYTVTDTWDGFETAFDTGMYNRYVLISLSNDDAYVKKNEGSTGKLDSGFEDRGEDHDLIQKELREAVNMGDGLVVIKSNPNDLQWLKDVTGVQWLGQMDDEQRTLRNVIVELRTALSPSGGTLTLTGQHTAVNMTLTTAGMAGYYSQAAQKCDYKHDDHDKDNCTCDDDHDKASRTNVAMAMNVYGMGEAVSMGFDPSYISETTQAQGLILNTLSFVGPNYQYMPYRLYPSSTQGIQISVTNLGVAVGLNITESVPANVGIGQVFNNGTITDSTILWHYALPVSASAAFSYTVTMPQTASSYTFTTGVWYNNGPQLTQYGSYPFTVTVTIEPRALLKQIISDVENLKVSHSDKEDKEKVLELLNKLHAKQDTIQPQEAVDIILNAIDELTEIQSADITQIRLNLDVELRMYEMRNKSAED